MVFNQILRVWVLSFISIFLFVSCNDGGGSSAGGGLVTPTENQPTPILSSDLEEDPLDVDNGDTLENEFQGVDEEELVELEIDKAEVGPTPAPAPILKVSEENEDAKKEDVIESEVGDSELINSIDEDLSAVSEVLADINDFVPLEKNISPLAFRGNLRKGPKYDLNKTPIQVFYRIENSGHIKRGDELGKFKQYILDLSENKISEGKELEFKSKIRRVFYTRKGEGYSLLNNRQIISLKKQKQLKGELLASQNYRVLPFSEGICFPYKKINALSVISDKGVTKFDIKGEPKKIRCYGDQAIVSYENQISFINLLKEQKLKTIDTPNCHKRRILHREGKNYFSCHNPGEKRRFFLMSEKQTEVELPKRISKAHEKYIVRLNQSDLQKGEAIQVLVKNKSTGNISHLGIESKTFPVPLKLINDGAKKIFVGKRDSYVFDKDFNLIEQNLLPFRPVYQGNGEILSNRLGRYRFDADFDFERYVFEGRKYLNLFFENKPVENYRVRNIKSFGDDIVLRTKDSLLKGNLESLQFTGQVELPKRARFSFNQNEVLVHKYDKGTQVHKLELNSFNGTKDIHEIAGLRGHHRFSFNEDSLLAFNGRHLSLYSKDTIEPLYKLHMRHFRQVFPLSSGKYLFLAPAKIVSVNGTEIQKVDLFLLDPRSENEPVKLDSVSVGHREIASVQLVGNHLLINKRDRALVVKRLNREQLLLGSIDE